MKPARHTRITWGLLILAITLHAAMIVNALFMMRRLHALDQRFSEEHNKLTAILSLTNAVRAAEEAVHGYSLDMSAGKFREYCADIGKARAAAAAVEEASALNSDLTSGDIKELEAALDARAAYCGGRSGAGSRAEAALEFSRFYGTASALRRKLAAHSRHKLEENSALALEGKQVTTALVIGSSAVATFILLLMAWLVYSLRRLNREIVAQRDEILVLKSGIEESPLGVVVTDASGTIEYVNPAFTAMHGYTPEEAVGKNPRLLKSGEMPPALYQSLWKALLGGRCWNGELHNRTKAGNLIWIRASICPVRNTKGVLTHFMALHKDITLEKRLMAELLQAKHEAEQANRAKSDFLASMSHEIRTPLNAIVGMSELIDDSALGREQAQYLAIMRNASDTLLTLINDILDISKIEAGKVDLEEDPFNLEELLSQISELMAVRAAKKGVELNCKLEADVPVFVEGDANRLRQVLMNLIGNAIKFVEKGWVSLSVKRQDGDGQNARLLFSVTDTGIGIAPDKLDAIFEKFTQADASTTRKYGGTGLGLPISKMLVELMGGRIWVESRAGEGSTFNFTVGLRLQKDRREVYLPKLDIKELKGKRFLVVDDNMINRIITREVVQSWGAACEGAADGPTALAKIQEEQLRGAPFHAVFVDFNMPGMDGLELSRRIMADKGMEPKPALAVLTSDTVRFNSEEFRAIGVNTHIIKPVKKRSLLDAALTMLAAAGTPAAAPPPNAALAGKEDLPALSVLIADDAEDNRILMSAMLKGSKVKLDLAVDGFEALDKFSKGSYDIVFMDMQMPGMDGYTATARIRELEQNEKRARTRIVALTAMATREDADRTLAAGCDDYLSKPIRKNTFYTYLRNFAAGR